MDIVELKSLNTYLIGCIPVGFDNDFIYLLKPNSEIIKIFKRTPNYDEIIDNLNFYSSLANRTYAGPGKILIKNNKVIGYTYPNFHMPKLNKIPLNTEKNKILGSYSVLMHDVKKLSENNLVLKNLESHNILYKDEFRLVNIEDNEIVLNNDSKDLYIYNMKKINELVIGAIFHHKEKATKFKDPMLQELYRRALEVEPYIILELIDKIFYKSDTIVDVRSRVKFISNK